MRDGFCIVVMKNVVSAWLLGRNLLENRLYCIFFPLLYMLWVELASPFAKKDANNLADVQSSFVVTSSLMRGDGNGCWNQPVKDNQVIPQQ